MGDNEQVESKLQRKRY